MAPHARPTPRAANPLEVPFRQLTIRTLASRSAAPAVDALERVRGEFVEMRGFSPTLQQAARLFHMAQDECSRVLTQLAGEGFIRRTPDGRYRLMNS